MLIPQPPWRFYGWLGMVVDWIDLDQVKPHLLPSPLEAVKVWGKGTLTAHLFASFEPREGATFQEPIHQFGYVSCKASHGDEQGYYLARLAADHSIGRKGYQRLWGVDAVPGLFDAPKGYILRANAEEGRVSTRVEFQKKYSLGYWEKSFRFLAFRDQNPARFEITCRGELFYCLVKRENLWNEGKVIPLLFDRCWVWIGGLGDER